MVRNDKRNVRKTIRTHPLLSLPPPLSLLFDAYEEGMKGRREEGTEKKKKKKLRPSFFFLLFFLAFKFIFILWAAVEVDSAVTTKS